MGQWWHHTQSWFCISALNFYCISWPWWLHTSWSQSRVLSVPHKTPPTQLGSVKEELGSYRQKAGYHPAVKNLHHIWWYKTLFWRWVEASCEKAWGVYSVSYVLAHSCLLRSLGNILKAFHGDILWCVPLGEKRPQRAVEFIDWMSQL